MGFLKIKYIINLNKRDGYSSMAKGMSSKCMILGLAP
jgi:hypothetical protein